MSELLQSIFFPHALSRYAALRERCSSRFVYYTSADTAHWVLAGKAVWMRNTQTMNDFQEVEHGIQCVRRALQANEGRGEREFVAALNAVWPGVGDEVLKQFWAWTPGFIRSTYITCVSEHDPGEDEHGRLSMWRAYGGRSGVALVFNGEPMLAPTDVLNAYSYPVSYANDDSYVSHLARVTSTLREKSSDLKAVRREQVLHSAFEMLRVAVLCTKHVGFAEEREWRIVTNGLNNRIPSGIEVVRGVPQKVYKLPLHHEQVPGMNLRALLHRVIIGPCEFPDVVWHAFVSTLKEAGIDDAIERVVCSGIPLRQS